MKKIYHGSKDIVTKPTFGYGKPYNDYGLGFYCTDDMRLAKEWGVDFNRDGYANQYEIECEDLVLLDLNGGQYNILHWLAVLLENRECDVIIDVERNRRRRGDLYIAQIMDEEMRADDARLRQTIS